jgi:hypothetical protein
MNERLGGRRDFAERMHVRHHVVAKASLIRSDCIEVDIVEVLAHLIDRFDRNGNSEIALSFG